MLTYKVRSTVVSRKDAPVKPGRKSVNHITSQSGSHPSARSFWPFFPPSPKSRRLQANEAPKAPTAVSLRCTIMQCKLYLKIVDSKYKYNYKYKYKYKCKYKCKCNGEPAQWWPTIHGAVWECAWLFLAVCLITFFGSLTDTFSLRRSTARHRRAVAEDAAFFYLRNRVFRSRGSSS